MIISIIYLIISFLLDNFMSNIFSSTFGYVSYFSTIYIIISFVVIYPYFSNDKKYFILIIIFGILFDVLYTSTFLINLVLFFVIALFIKLLNNFLPNNIFMANILSFSCIIVYHVLTFLILNIASGSIYGFVLLGDILTHSLIMTVLYTSVSYFIIKLIYNKFNIKVIK